MKIEVKENIVCLLELFRNMLISNSPEEDIKKKYHEMSYQELILNLNFGFDLDKFFKRRDKVLKKLEEMNKEVGEKHYL